jgi:hypothetical protein
MLAIISEAERIAQRALGLTVKLPVWSVYVDASYGMDIRLFRTREDAQAWLASYVREILEHESGRSDELEAFNAHDNEFEAADDWLTNSGTYRYDIDYHEIEVAISEVMK